MPINKTPVNIKQKEFVLTAPKYSFEDVVLPRNAEDEIELALGMYENAYEVYVEWGLDKVIRRRKGLSVNLYGPSGTGKTITSHAIANSLNKKILYVNYGEIESTIVEDVECDLENGKKSYSKIWKKID